MITEDKKQKLLAEYRRLSVEMERCRNKNQMMLAESYENSLARIEGQLQAEDINPADYED